MPCLVLARVAGLGEGAVKQTLGEGAERRKRAAEKGTRYPSFAQGIPRPRSRPHTHLAPALKHLKQGMRLAVGGALEVAAAGHGRVQACIGCVKGCGWAEGPHLTAGSAPERMRRVRQCGAMFVVLVKSRHTTGRRQQAAAAAEAPARGAPMAAILHTHPPTGRW